jgi:hypothetical protein
MIFSTSPFDFVFLPLVVCPYRALNVPQYPLRQLDRCQSKFQNFFVRVVPGNIRKFFGDVSRLEPAAGHYTVDGAVRYEVFISLITLGISSSQPLYNAG